MDNTMVVHEWERYAIGDNEEIRQLRLELMAAGWLDSENAIIIYTTENLKLFWNRYDIVFQDEILKNAPEGWSVA